MARLRRLVCESARSGEFPSLAAAWHKKGAARAEAFQQSVLSNCQGKVAEARMKQELYSYKI